MLLRILVGVLLIGSVTYPVAFAATQETTLGPVKLVLTTDRDAVRVGDELVYAVSVQSPRNVAVEFEPVDDVFGGFAVTARKPSGPVDQDEDTYRWERKYTLVPDSAGTFTIPTIAVNFVERSEPIVRAPCVTARDCFLVKPPEHDDITNTPGHQVIRTEPVVVEVAAAPVPVTASADPSRTPAGSTSQGVNVGWVGAALLLITCTSLFFWMQQNRKIAADRSPQVADAPIPVMDLSGHAALHRAFAELQQRSTRGRGQHHEQQQDADCLFNLAQQHVAQTCEADTLHMTSEELGATYTNADTEPAARASLNKVLHHVDSIRYAAYQADSDEWNAVFADAGRVFGAQVDEQARSDA